MSTGHYAGNAIAAREKRIKRIAELEAICAAKDALLAEYGRAAIKAGDAQADAEALGEHNWDHMWRQLIRREAEIDEVLKENKALKAEIKRLNALAASDLGMSSLGNHYQIETTATVGCPLCVNQCICEDLG